MSVLTRRQGGKRDVIDAAFMQHDKRALPWGTKWK